MSLTRTFHPVGQGAFYSESFDYRDGDTDKTFLMVYDCGSTTLSKKELDKKISSLSAKEIDLLVISHFHVDHIKGIETLAKNCKIKRVMIPETENGINILRIANFISHSFSDTRIFQNPREIFDIETVIITIGEENPDESNAVVLPDNNQTDIPIQFLSAINDPNEKYTFKSGQVFGIIPNNNVDWFYIPFNYRHNECMEQFEKELKIFNLDLAKIDTIEKIIKNRSKITKAYKKIQGDLNVNSLVLFAGNEQKKMNIKPCNKKEEKLNFVLCLTQFETGCLYMGDVNLKSKNIISQMKKRFDNLFKHMGTVQIPHHGSIHNFDKLFLDHLEKTKCFILSYGTNNPYSHPSLSVIKYLKEKYFKIFCVTEEDKTKVVQTSVLN